MLLSIDIESKLVYAVRTAMEYLKGELISELKAQGHVHTGSLINDIDIYIENIGGDIYGAIKMLDYAETVENGITATEFQSYSQNELHDHRKALFAYFKKKGLSGTELKRATFSTLNKHLKEGMPTRASMRFARNGRRTGFVTQIYNNKIDNAQQMILNDLFPYIDIAFYNIINQAA